MAKFYRLTSRWYQEVQDYDELPSGKVYYCVDGKKYHPANREDFIDAEPSDFASQVKTPLGTFCRMERP